MSVRTVEGRVAGAEQIDVGHPGQEDEFTTFLLAHDSG